MKLHEILHKQIDEGLREKALAGILSLGLSFASQVDASEVYVYTDDKGSQQVVATYDEVPKGKMVHVVDVEDMDVKTIQKRAQQEWKAKPAMQGVSDEARRQMYRTDI